jgi:translation initiation factor 1 (eIF-1/SUI1)
LLRKLKAGKAGKTVTEISGWPGNEDLSLILLDLKRRFGTGGTCKARVIELQGEWREALRMYLASLGFKVKG